MKRATRGDPDLRMRGCVGENAAGSWVRHRSVHTAGVLDHSQGCGSRMEMEDFVQTVAPKAPTAEMVV